MGDCFASRSQTCSTMVWSTAIKNSTAVCPSVRHDELDGVFTGILLCSWWPRNRDVPCDRCSLPGSSVPKLGPGEHGNSEQEELLEAWQCCRKLPDFRAQCHRIGMWLFPKIRCPFCGRPCNKSSTVAAIFSRPSADLRMFAHQKPCPLSLSSRTSRAKSSLCLSQLVAG